MRLLTLLIAGAAWAEDALQQAERLLASGQYRQALQALNSAPETSVRRRLLASQAFEGLRDPAQAVAEAERGLALDPLSEAAHLRLGQIFLSHNTPQAALEVFSEAQQRFPMSFLVKLGHGLALKELQRYDEAEVELRACLDRNPGSGIAFDALGTTLLHALKYEELLRAAESFASRNPQDFRGEYYLAAARDGMRLPDDVSRGLLESSLRKNPVFAASHALLGKILLRQNAVNEAVAALERAVALRADHLPSHMSLAKAYRTLGKEIEAAREYQLIRDLNEKAREPKPSLRYHRGP